MKNVFIPLSELNKTDLTRIFQTEAFKDAEFICPYCKTEFTNFMDLKEHLEKCVSRKKALKYHPYPYSPANAQTKITEWL